jgi:hypothetical protein
MIQKILKKEIVGADEPNELKLGDVPLSMQTVPPTKTPHRQIMFEISCESAQ